ncbi:MAG: dihydrolipoamide acetyltransferase family protein, partial [Bacteroidetes bacterium]|nr:dihydrolipoamide acetyltransferase family protein [Bacteroidota bacterium]
MAIVDLVMPKLGESIMEATILKWNKQIGDNIAVDETVLEIATDKVDTEVPAPFAGKLVEICFQVNDVAPIGSVLAKIEIAGENNAVVNTIVETPAPMPAAAPAPTREEIESIPYVPAAPVNTAPQETGNTETRFYSPLVLNIAQSEGVSFSDLEKIPGTGSGGRVSKKDILNWVAAKKSGTTANVVSPSATPVNSSASAPVATAVAVTTQTQASSVAASASTSLASSPAGVVLSGASEIIEMDRMRKLIAKHMVDSVQTSPHVTSFSEADVTNLVQWRNNNKATFEKREGTKLTFTPLIVECLVAAMKKFPLINSSLDGDKIIIKKDFNIGMATALPNGNLIVPVIKGADQLNLVGLSKSINSLADAARNNKLKPDDTQNGTFTFTNVGTFGSLMGTPIINQPQVAIIAVGAIKKRVAVIETPSGDSMAIRHMMYLSLSYDHRIIDGSVGASFLTEVANQLEA